MASRFFVECKLPTGQVGAGSVLTLAWVEAFLGALLASGDFFCTFLVPASLAHLGIELILSCHLCFDPLVISA